jgi:hypothetical protein
MKRMIITATSLSCVLSAGLAYALAARRADADANPGASDHAALVEVQAELRRVKQELSDRRSQRALELLQAARRADPEAAASSDGAEEESEGEQEDGSDTRPRAPDPRTVTEEQAKARLADRFAREPMDMAWRREATAQLQRQFSATATAGSRVTGIDCRQSLCRVDTIHKDFDTYREFAHAAITSPHNEWRGGTLMHVLGEPNAGELRAVAYLARPGEDLGRMLQDEQ